MKTQPTNLAIADLLRYFSGRFVSLGIKDGHLGLSLRIFLVEEGIKFFLGKFWVVHYVTVVATIAHMTCNTAHMFVGSLLYSVSDQ